VRWEIGQGLAHLGVQLDPTRNANGATMISVDGARVVSRAIATNENLMVAAHTGAALFGLSVDEVLASRQLSISRLP
jgi:acetate kinase